jgi:hypothetical protein
MFCNATGSTLAFSYGFIALAAIVISALLIFGVGVAKVIYDNIRDPFYVTTNAVLLLVTGLAVGALGGGGSAPGAGHNYGSARRG